MEEKTFTITGRPISDDVQSIFGGAGRTVTGRPISDDVQSIFGGAGRTVTGLKVQPNGAIVVFYGCGLTLIWTPMVFAVEEGS
jgi:hypothetical protein